MAGTTEEALLIRERTGVQVVSDTDFAVRKKVLSYFLRFESLEGLEGSFIELNHILVDRVSKETNASRNTVINVIGLFLREVSGFHQLLNSEFVTWSPGKSHLFRKVRFFLRKVHKVAPVFDYPRALGNLELLHVLLARKNFWPHISTQLALVVFVTDRNDLTYPDNNYILQKNLRAFCSCSAYAFHMVRNRLGINKEGKLGSRV